MTRAKPVHGMFRNNMAYTRIGTGSRTILSVPGGPGNCLPTGLMETMALKMFEPFLADDYSVWFVTRRLDMPPGHTIEDMADDYAQLIRDEFRGQVDVYLGISYGGAIGIYLAANHPDRFGHIVLVGIGYEISEERKQLDYSFAKKLSEGKRSEAGMIVADDMLAKSWLRRFPWIKKVIGPPMGLFMFGGRKHRYFSQDVLTEAEAELIFDARDVLPMIEVPVLLIGGDRDDYFPRHILEDTASLIPNCTLRLYEGKSHEGAISDKRMARDALHFISRN